MDFPNMMWPWKQMFVEKVGLIWAMNKNFVELGYFGDENLPTYMGIIIYPYKDSYE